MTMPVRRFPPPWTVVKDSRGQKLGYFYYEEEPGRRAAILTAIRLSEAIVPSAGDDHCVMNFATTIRH
jgi:hypothetical protein